MRDFLALQYEYSILNSGFAYVCEDPANISDKQCFFLTYIFQDKNTQNNNHIQIFYIKPPKINFCIKL